MLAQNSNDSPYTPLGEDTRVTVTHITVRIPPNFHQEPIISRLILDHGLIVNITAALLGEDTKDDGWFNLELRGTSSQIQSGLIYLEELDLEVWSKQDSEEENW